VSDPDTWVVVYTAPTKRGGLDDFVSNRRTAIFKIGGTDSYDERRYFLPGWPDYVPASIATYDLHSGLGRSRYLVLCAETDTHVIELVAYTDEPETRAGELRELLDTLAPGAGGDS